MIFKKLFLVLFFLLSVLNPLTYSKTDKPYRAAKIDESTNAWIEKAKSKIQKKTLSNGMTVIFYPITHSPVVSIRVIVDFGSRDEHEGQYGFAHMIEHMFFKGTPSISEVDINVIANKFGQAYVNAFTRCDDTTYIVQTDNKNWPIFMGILADCMQNARFDEDHFNSEVKAVVSEINLHRKDTHTAILSACLPFNHPYAHPVCGLREDLLNSTASDLKNFYKQNYTPEKTTLIVVGDIEQAEIFDQIEKLFGTMPASTNPTKRIYNSDAYLQPNFIQGNVSVHTQTERPAVELWWLVPGAKNSSVSVTAKAFSHILNDRLEKLNKSYGLTFNISVFFDSSLDIGKFTVNFEPKTEDFGKFLNSGSCVETIKAIIFSEIVDVACNGVKFEELSNFKALNRISFTTIFENVDEIARVLGAYSINKNEYEAFDRFQDLQSLESQDIKNFCKTYLKINRSQQLNIVPLEDNEKNEWVELQNLIDQYESTLLCNKNRESKLEEQRLLLSLPEPKSLDFKYEKPDLETTLSNGLKVYVKHRDITPEVFVGLSFKNVEYLNLFYAQQNKAAIPSYVGNLLDEETAGDQLHPENFTQKENKDFFDSLGAKFMAFNRSVSCLPCYVEKVTKKLLHILNNPIYPEQSLNREVNNEIQLLKQDQDNIGSALLKDIELYLLEQYHWVRNDEQKIADLKQITRQDLVDFTKQWIAPQNMVLTIVGNIDPEVVVAQMEKVLGKWNNPEALNIDDLKNKISVPDISNPAAKQIIKPRPHEQVVLIAGRVGFCRGTDHIIIWNLVSNYLNEKLHEIREQSGLFYYCFVVQDADSFLTKGKIILLTEVSTENLEPAKEAIIKVLRDFSVNGISQKEFDDAKMNIRTNFAKDFSTTREVFNDYCDLISHDKTFDYHKERLDLLNSLTLDYVNSVIKEFVDPDKMTFVIGGKI